MTQEIRILALGPLDSKRPGTLEAKGDAKTHSWVIRTDMGGAALRMKDVSGVSPLLGLPHKVFRRTTTYIPTQNP